MDLRILIRFSLTLLLCSLSFKADSNCDLEGMISIRKKTGTVQNRSRWLQLSSKIDCGLQLLVQLVSKRTDLPISLRTIAENNGISFYFLQKVAADLRKAGIIKAGRGKNGGYSLAKAPKDITILNILEAHEGPVSLMYCLDNHAGGKCFKSNECNVRPGLDFINQTIIQTFSKTTLLDFINLSFNEK